MRLPDAQRSSSVMTSINSGLTLEPLLSHILYSRVTLIQATYGTIGLVVERNDGSTIRTVAVYNLPNGELDAEMRYGIKRVATTRWKHSMNNPGWNR